MVRSALVVVDIPVVDCQLRGCVGFNMVSFFFFGLSIDGPGQQ
jgi:hypothetical protein